MTLEKKIYIFILLFLPLKVAFAQTINLSDIQNLSPKEIEKLQGDLEARNSRDSFDEQNDSDEVEEFLYRNEEKEEFSDEEYGYKGREDFLLESKPKIDKEADPIRRFGYDYFSKYPTTFAPLKNIPIPKDYLLGPGDEIRILLYGNTNRDYKLEVTRDGDIFLPEVGPISVAGITFTDLKDVVTKIVSNKLIGTDVSLTLGELRSINIYVLGEANKPGMYTLSSLATTSNAIFASGGIKTSGSLRNIQLKRKGKTISNFDLYDLLLNGDSSNNMRLMSGDVIFIPPITKTVAIEGEVNRPGIFELEGDETSDDIISFAGGFRPKADISNVELRRVDKYESNFKLLKKDFTKASSESIDLIDGDTIIVYSIREEIKNAILLSGHLPQTGFTPWFDGMRLSDLFPSEKAMLPLTDMKYGLVQRFINGGSDLEFFQIDFQELFSNINTEKDFYIQESDQIMVFPQRSYCELIALTEKNYDKDIEDNSSSIGQINKVTQNEVTQEKALRDIVDLIESDSLNNEDELSESLNCREEILAPVITLIESTSKNGAPPDLVRVLGNVAFPGQYPLTSGATLKNILEAAGNIDQLSYIEEIEIIRNRMTEDQILQEIITVDAGSIDELSLRPLDLITVKKIKSDYQTVEIAGGVLFPGQYVIQEEETLLSLIERSGGFSSEANLSNIIFTRKELASRQESTIKESQKELQKQIILLQADNSFSDNNDNAYIEKLLELSNTDTSTMLLGRLVFNFSKIEEGTLPDIELRDGDKITIPKDDQTVSVVGEVFAPNSHIYSDQLSISDYIDLSGGVNDFGDLSNAYLIRGNGSVVPIKEISSGGFFRVNNSYVSAGDTIVIPIKVNNNLGIRTANEITQIIYQLAVATAAIQSFNK